MLKIYLLKLLAVLFGIVAGILYLCNINMNVIVTLLAIAGVLLYVDTRINKTNIYMSNLKYMADKKNKNGAFMKKKIIFIILAILLVVFAIIFVKTNYKKEAVTIKVVDKTESKEKIEDILAKNDFKDNNKIQIESFKSYNNDDSILLEGGIAISYDKGYIFFGENSKSDMKAITGVKDKYLKDLNEGESLFILTKDGKANCVISSDDGIVFDKQTDYSKSYLEIYPDTITILDLTITDNIYKFIY